MLLTSSITGDIGAVSAVDQSVGAAVDPGAVAALSDDDLRTEHDRMRDALGFPRGRTTTVSRLVGRGHLNDQVEETDQRGHPVVLSEFAPGQSLVASMRLDQGPSEARLVTASTAAANARSARAALGFGDSAPDQIWDDDSTGGWGVAWGRTEAGYAVRGDGTIVYVWPDGRIQSFANQARTLAAAPGARISSGEAIMLSQAFITSPGRQGPTFVIAKPRLEWVSPNGAFDSALPADGLPVLRLAWVVDAQSEDENAVPWLVTVFLDAGSSQTLGGEVVE